MEDYVKRYVNVFKMEIDGTFAQVGDVGTYKGIDIIVVDKDSEYYYCVRANLPKVEKQETIKDKRIVLNLITDLLQEIIKL